MKFWGELAVAAGLIALHCAVISRPGRKVQLSTSNIITNCIRIGDLRAESRPYCVLAGSSMTGRLDAAAAEKAAGLPVINLGLDGCGPVEALDFLLSAPTPPQLVLLELNSLGSVSPENARAVMEATAGPAEKLRQFIPFLRHEERPVDLVYSWMHSRLKVDTSLKIGSPSLPAPEIFNRPGEPPDSPDPLAVMLLERIRSLQARGSRVVLVMLPDNSVERPREYAAAAAVSSQLSLPMFDLKPQMDKVLTYTDSVHLTPVSSQALSAALGTWIRKAAGAGQAPR